jgi:hypothetical protein
MIYGIFIGLVFGIVLMYLWFRVRMKQLISDWLELSEKEEVEWASGGVSIYETCAEQLNSIIEGHDYQISN